MSARTGRRVSWLLLFVAASCGGRAIDGAPRTSEEDAARPVRGAPGGASGAPPNDGASPAHEGAVDASLADAMRTSGEPKPGADAGPFDIRSARIVCGRFLSCPMPPSTPLDIDWCLENIQLNREDARRFGCIGPYDALFECLARNGTCADPSALAVCGSLSEPVLRCLGPNDAGAKRG